MRLMISQPNWSALRSNASTLPVHPDRRQHSIILAHLEQLRKNQTVEQVKVNAVIPDETRETIRAMALEYGTTVQRIVGTLIGYGVRNMTAKEVRGSLAKSAKNSPTKQYVRTKPF